MKALVVCDPAPAGFPLTDTRLAGAYAVISGHDAANISWAAYQHIPTLVVLMGGRQLGVIAQQLMATGWAPDVPVSRLRAVADCVGAPHSWSPPSHAPALDLLAAQQSPGGTCEAVAAVAAALWRRQNVCVVMVSHP